MKGDEEFRNQLTCIVNDYEAEVRRAQREGNLTENTAKTYLVHTSNFVKWCNGNFKPGGRNKG
ncbi:hypothetical protein SAMN05421743_11457 [Thalassobacillus cyri]|uniref:Uncharacterized protein n=1 Tax=Thalassobacillus cyri TaxID=571932 RepID=A0A1H4G6T2_9BACI|nr:hypothetical protein [Thalassobacillus cyri]SEB05305.1 hypothetical protein SAMN05421743_11457 [Thalassobacillus cyri]